MKLCFQRKRRLVGFTVLSIVSLVAISWFLLGPGPNVVGDIPENELTQINATVRKEMFARVFGPSGRRDFKRYPELVKYYFSHPILQIERTNRAVPFLGKNDAFEYRTADVVEVLFKGRWHGDVGYLLEKTNGSWEITVHLFD